MEPLLIKDYALIVKKHYKLMGMTLLACLLIAALITLFFPKSYSSSIDVYVRHKEATTSSTYYTYDGYYSTQASVQYTDTVTGFLESLSTVQEAGGLVQADPLYKSGGYTPQTFDDDADYLASFQKNISVATVAPQLITVSVHSSDKTLAELWSQAMGTVITSKLKELNLQGDPNFSIDTIDTPLTQTVRLNMVVDLAIGLIIGIFLGFVFGFIREAYKK